MASASFKPDRDGFKEMAVGSELRAACLEVATRGRQVAVGLASEFRQSGEYMDSFHVRSDTVILNTGFGSHPVAAGILENTSEHAAAVEWGNADDHRPHRVLGRTLDGLENA